MNKKEIIEEVIVNMANTTLRADEAAEECTLLESCLYSC